MIHSGIAYFIQYFQFFTPSTAPFSRFSGWNCSSWPPLSVHSIYRRVVAEHRAYEFSRSCKYCPSFLPSYQIVSISPDFHPISYSISIIISILYCQSFNLLKAYLNRSPLSLFQPTKCPNFSKLLTLFIVYIHYSREEEGSVTLQRV